MIESELISLVGTLGFPIVMCLWFMFRTEKIIKHNTQVMEKILIGMDKCKARAK